MSKRKGNTGATEGGASVNTEELEVNDVVEQKEIELSFTCKQFRFKGIEYNSAVVEAAANAEEPWALDIVGQLITKKSGIISVK